MNTCKTTFRIMWAHRGALLGYLIGCGVLMVFLGFGVISTMTSDKTDVTFDRTTTSIAIVDRDEESGHVFQHGLEQALGDTAQIVHVPDTKRDLQDALASDQAKLIVIIPDGYAADVVQSIRQGGDMTAVECASSYGSGSIAMAKMQVTGFLDEVRTALASNPDFTVNAAIDQVVDQRGDLPQVTVQATGDNNTMDTSSIVVAGYGMTLSTMIYPAMAVMTLAVGLVVSKFNADYVRERLSASACSSLRINGQVMLACLVLALTTWLYYSALSLAVVIPLRGGLAALGAVGITLSLTAALALTFMALAFGFMIGQFVSSVNATNGIANAVSMVLLFLSGIWTPASMMPEAVVTIAKFTPGWWYVQAVYQSFGGRDINAVNPPDWSGWGASMAILLLFAAAFVCIGLAVGRIRQNSPALRSAVVTNMK